MIKINELNGPFPWQTAKYVKLPEGIYSHEV